MINFFSTFALFIFILLGMELFGYAYLLCEMYAGENLEKVV